MNSCKIKNRRSINQNSIEVAHDATLEQRFISCSQDHTKLKILGISAYYHDSAASLIVNGEIIAAAEEERFSRIKHDSSFPLNAISFCLACANLTIGDIDQVVFYEKPFLKFERILESYFRTAPFGLKSFVKSMPTWFSEKLFIKQKITKQLRKLDKTNKKDFVILFPEHHLSHSASAFFTSPFETSAILTIDGVGEWTTASISHGKGNGIELIKELRFPHSVGLLYSAFTYFLGFKVNSGEYKLMGLAGYGNKSDLSTSKYVSTIKSELIQLFDDGSIELNMNFFSFQTSLKMVKAKDWELLFGIIKRLPEDDFSQEHANLALAIQIVTEEIVSKLSKHAKELTGEENLCIAGGVGLNCVSNGNLERSGIFKSIFIFPASGDSGGALGASLAVDYIHNNRKRIPTLDPMKGSLLGSDISNSEIEVILSKYEIELEAQSDRSLLSIISEELSNGKVIARCCGRMEYGPRALGNRSILGDPRVKDMQLRINQLVKKRESFRPFAPVILESETHKFFDIKEASPYMLRVHPMREEFLHNLPPDFDSFSIKDKLKFEKSIFPAISHADHSSRLQTVDAVTNPKFHDLLSAFFNQTGCPMLINTSFNERGEPIVRTATEAFECFMRTDIDILVLNNYIFDKKALTTLDPARFMTTFEDD